MGPSCTIFHTYVDELIYHLETVNCFVKIRDTALKNINIGLLPDPERTIALQAFKSPAFSIDRLLPMFVLSLHAGFEEYLRQLVIEFADRINARKMPHKLASDRCQQILLWNMRQTGAGLLTVFEPLDHLQLDFDSMAKNLATTTPGSEATVLNGQSLSIRDRNLTSKGLEHYFKRVGIEIKWNELCKEKNLQLAFGNLGLTKTANAVQDFLDSSIKERNRLAHSQGAVGKYTRQDVDTVALKLKGIATGIDVVVQEKLTEFCAA